MTTYRDRISSVALARWLRIERVLRAVAQLRADALAAEQDYAPLLAKIPPVLRESAYNLVHYLAVRRHDIRELQYDLSVLGLSSLGRMEAHVMATLQSVLETLHALAHRSPSADLRQEPPITFEVGRIMLQENANSIFGEVPPHQPVRIMVTMPSEASESPELIEDLLAQGMNVMRINCAHDTPVEWQRMIDHLRQAERRLGKRCRISFDLAGPKLRTGPMTEGPGLVKWHPAKTSAQGTRAAIAVWLVAGPVTVAPAGKWLPVETALIQAVQVGDRLLFTDGRGEAQTLTVVEVLGDRCRCESTQKTCVTDSAVLTLTRQGTPLMQTPLGPLPPKPQTIKLATGDWLQLVRGQASGQPARLADDGTVIEPAQISCEVAEIFQDVQPGERIFLDDGIFSGIVRQVEGDRVLIELVAVLGGEAKLKNEKGINLPDTDLSLPALTDKDKEDLAFIARQGDLVAMSFVQHPRDIEALVAELNRLGARNLGLILKIETQRAFNNLPNLLLTAMQHPPLAVMVARGDLGVEVGFERLSEVQEEILWLCEAAHVPVIWATQVLENLAKGGLPSRAEVTDAAVGSRAECVMLNKGPYINQAMEFLQDVWQRMQAHQQKKTAMLRKLSISEARDL